MSLIKFAKSNVKLISAFVVMLCGILFQEYLISAYKSFKGTGTEHNKYCSDTDKLYSSQLLSEYNGINKHSLYLSLMGIIFDVTKGRKQYERGAPYHYFVGKDGTRSFITGNFQDITEDKDHVLDLPCEDLFALVNWRDTFSRKYTKVGILEGRYFDQNCQETEYSIQLRDRLKNCKLEKQRIKEQEMEYPPCNMAWSADEGTTVWCTSSSGGVSRSWVGVPRQLYTPGNEKPHCVCVNLDATKPQGMLKRYENCAAESTSCAVIS